MLINSLVVCSGPKTKSCTDLKGNVTGDAVIHLELQVLQNTAPTKVCQYVGTLLMIRDSHQCKKDDGWRRADLANLGGVQQAAAESTGRPSADMTMDSLCKFSIYLFTLAFILDSYK